MTLTSISQAARDRERVNLFIDGEFVLGIDKNTLTHFGLHQGMEVSAELISEISHFDTVQYLYRRMISLWLKRPRSHREMRMKMQEMQRKRQRKLSNDQCSNDKLNNNEFNDQSHSGKREEEEIVGDRGRWGEVAGGVERWLEIGGDEGEIEQVLKKMRDAGYTDQKFAEWYVTERGRQGKYGPRKVLVELQSKGVSQKIANAALAKFFPENNLAEELLQKKFGVSKLSEIKDVKEKARAWRLLKSRGF